MNQNIHNFKNFQQGKNSKPLTKEDQNIYTEKAFATNVSLKINMHDENQEKFSNEKNMESSSSGVSYTEADFLNKFSITKEEREEYVAARRKKIERESRKIKSSTQKRLDYVFSPSCSLGSPSNNKYDISDDLTFQVSEYKTEIHGDRFKQRDKYRTNAIANFSCGEKIIPSKEYSFTRDINDIESVSVTDLLLSIDLSSLLPHSIKETELNTPSTSVDSAISTAHNIDSDVNLLNEINSKASVEENLKVHCSSLLYSSISLMKPSLPVVQNVNPNVNLVNKENNTATEVKEELQTDCVSSSFPLSIPFVDSTTSFTNNVISDVNVMSDVSSTIMSCDENTNIGDLHHQNSTVTNLKTNVCANKKRKSTSILLPDEDTSRIRNSCKLLKKEQYSEQTSEISVVQSKVYKDNEIELPLEDRENFCIEPSKQNQESHTDIANNSSEVFNHEANWDLTTEKVTFKETEELIPIVENEATFSHIESIANSKVNENEEYNMLLVDNQVKHTVSEIEEISLLETLVDPKLNRGSIDTDICFQEMVPTSLNENIDVSQSKEVENKLFDPEKENSSQNKPESLNNDESTMNVVESSRSSSQEEEEDATDKNETTSVATGSNLILPSEIESTPNHG